MWFPPLKSDTVQGYGSLNLKAEVEIVVTAVCSQGEEEDEMFPYLRCRSPQISDEDVLLTFSPTRHVHTLYLWKMVSVAKAYESHG